jgi:hypothetical protein
LTLNFVSDLDFDPAVIAPKQKALRIPAQGFLP